MCTIFNKVRIVVLYQNYFKKSKINKNDKRHDPFFAKIFYFLPNLVPNKPRLISFTVVDWTGPTGHTDNAIILTCSSLF